MIGHVVLQSQAMLKASVSCLELLLLLPAFGHVDLERLVPSDDRAPLEAQEYHAAPNEQPHKKAPDCDADDSTVVQVTTLDV